MLLLQQRSKHPREMVLTPKASTSNDSMCGGGRTQLPYKRRLDTDRIGPCDGVSKGGAPHVPREEKVGVVTTYL